MTSKQDGRSQNGVGKTRFFEQRFHLDLPLKVRPVGGFGGVGHGELDHALHTRPLGGLIQALRVVHRRVVRKTVLFLVVANPVGVVQHFRTAQRFHQAVHVVEIQPVNLNPSIERVVPADRIGQGSNLNVLLQKVMSNPSSRVAEGTGHNVKRPVHAPNFPRRT